MLALAPLALTPLDALAQPAPADGKKTSALSWARIEGAEACSGAPELARRVEALLGRAVIVSPAQADLSIEGRVEQKKPHGFRATIVMAKGSGEIVGRRELDTDEACRALDEPVSLAIALMIDPDASLRPPAPAPDVHHDAKPDVIVKETVKTVYVPVHDKPVGAPKRPYRFEGFVGGAMGLGLTPLSGGFLAGGALDPPWFGAFEIDGALLIADVSIPGASSGGVRFFHASGSAFFCPLAGNVGLLLGALCAGGEAGFVATAAHDLPDGNGTVKPLVDGAARGRIGIWPSPVTVELGATFSVPILRNTFVYQTEAGGPKKTLFDSAPVAGMFDLTIGFRLPGR